MRSRVSAWVLLAVLVLFPWVSGGSPSPSPSSSSAIRFAVIADQTGGAMPGVYDSVLAEVARLDPDFVVTVGDHVEGYTGKDTTLLRTEFEQVCAQYDSAFGPRWRTGDFLIPTPGNHDITQDEAEPAWRRFFGTPTRRVDRPGVTILSLDSSRPIGEQRLNDPEIRFLEREIPSIPDGVPVLVLTHKPWFSETLWRDRADRAHALFTKRGNVTVLTGHWHSYAYAPRDGVTYVVCGSSGGTMNGLGSSNGDFVGFIWGTIRDGRVTLAPISLGNVHPVDMMSERESEAVSAFTMGGLSTSAFDLARKDARITVTARNAGDRTSADSIRWSAPAGWAIAPATAAVTVEPGDSATAEFAVTRIGSPFPIPTASAGLHYGREKRVVTSIPLRLARNTLAPRLSSIRVDGTIDAAEWGTAPAETLFMAPDAGASTCDPSRFLFAWDERGIYLGARCATAPGHEIRAEIADRDGPVHREDCVGWFLSPADSVIYQIYVNPKGAVFDGRGRRTPSGMTMDYTWNGDVQAVASRAPDGAWSVEVFVPYATLGLSPGASAREIRMNMRRKQPAVGSAADWLPISYEPRDLGVLRLEL